MLTASGLPASSAFAQQRVMVGQRLQPIGMVVLLSITIVAGFNAGAQIRPFPSLSTRPNSFSLSSSTKTTVVVSLMTRQAISSSVQAEGQKSAKLEANGLRDIAKTVFEGDKRPVILYDGVCNMCNGFVNLLLDIDTTEKFRFSALQSDTGRALLALSGRSPDDISRYFSCCNRALTWLAVPLLPPGLQHAP